MSGGKRSGENRHVAGLSPAAVCVRIAVVHRIMNQLSQMRGGVPKITVRGNMIASEGVDADKDNLLFFDPAFSITLNSQQKE